MAEIVSAELSSVDRDASELSLVERSAATYHRRRSAVWQHSALGILVADHSAVRVSSVDLGGVELLYQTWGEAIGKILVIE